MENAQGFQVDVQLRAVGVAAELDEERTG